MRVLGQGICSASDIFNVVTDSSTRLDDNVVKNMDDICFFAESLGDLEKVVCEFLKFCRLKNLKLKTDKFRISEHVEFAGATINAELVRGERIVNMCPTHLYPTPLHYPMPCTTLNLTVPWTT